MVRLACGRGLSPVVVTSGCVSRIRTGVGFPIRTGTVETVDGVVVVGTVGNGDPVREVELVTGAGAAVWCLDTSRSGQSRRADGGQGAGGGVFGYADGGTDVSDADWSKPSLFDCLGLVGQLLEDRPGERTEPAPPESASGIED
jgi:hypothetical protein